MVAEEGFEDGRMRHEEVLRDEEGKALDGALKTVATLETATPSPA